jgi:hypothetical protein
MRLPRSEIAGPGYTPTFPSTVVVPVFVTVEAASTEYVLAVPSGTTVAAACTGLALKMSSPAPNNAIALEAVPAAYRVRRVRGISGWSVIVEPSFVAGLEETGRSGSSRIRSMRAEMC